MAEEIVGLRQHQAQREEVGLVRALGLAPDLGRQVVQLGLQDGLVALLARELVALGLVLAGRPGEPGLADAIKAMLRAFQLTYQCPLAAQRRVRAHGRARAGELVSHH